MGSNLKISGAASIALHAMAFIAANPARRVSTKEIKSRLKVSEAHLSKVLQWLVRDGLVLSSRGPGGGFELRRRASSITLGRVYKAIEGDMPLGDCLFDKAICGGRQCIFGDLLSKAGKMIERYFKKTTLADVAGVYK